MATYKITNITNLVGKRDRKYNSTVNIDYVDNMKKKTVRLKPGETLYLTISYMSIPIQKLKIGKYIDILEISGNNLNALMKPPTTTKTPEVAIETPKPEIVTKPEEPIVVIKKKNITKESENLNSNTTIE